MPAIGRLSHGVRAARRWNRISCLGSGRFSEPVMPLPRQGVPHVEAAMAEVLLFHHAQGLTPGVVAFADELRAAGHIVHTPDLFGGGTFESISGGTALLHDTGLDEVRAPG